MLRQVSAVTQVQTYNDPAFVKARNRPLGADSDVAGGRPLGTYSSGFEVALEREGSNGETDANMNYING